MNFSNYAAIFCSALAVIMIDAELITRRRKRQRLQPNFGWLTPEFRELVSPELNRLLLSLPRMRRFEQYTAVQVLNPALQALLAQSVERLDKTTTDELLSWGVDPSAPVPGRKNAFETALSMPSSLTPMAELTENVRRIDSSHLTMAARAAHIDAMALLLDAATRRSSDADGVQQSLFDKCPEDLLFQYCAAHHIKADDVKKLLTRMGPKARKFIHARDNFGRTPLHVASYFQNQNIAGVLEGFGANKFARDYFEETPDDLKDHESAFSEMLP